MFMYMYTQGHMYIYIYLSIIFDILRIWRVAELPSPKPCQVDINGERIGLTKAVDIGIQGDAGPAFRG